MRVLTRCFGISLPPIVEIIVAFSPEIGGPVFDRQTFAGATAANSARADFVRVQLELAISYCLLAEASDLAFVSNHVKNARRAYQNVMRFMWRAGLPGRELSEIIGDAAQLKFRIEGLEHHLAASDRQNEHSRSS